MGECEPWISETTITEPADMRGVHLYRNLENLFAIIKIFTRACAHVLKSINISIF